MVINNQEEIKITKINKRFHARLIINGAIHDEMACSFKRDIGHICREMLRWYDKMGGSKWSSFSRKNRRNDTPIGKIWYRKDL